MKESYENFEDTFHALLAKAKKKPISVKTLLTTLSGKGRVLLIIFLSLGFGQIPGISIFFGIFIAYLGLRTAIPKNFIWMPNFLFERHIPSSLLTMVLNQILRFLTFLKYWSYPRYVWFTRHAKTRLANGLTISLVGIAFASSPPVPFAGWIATLSILLIAIGILNDDGLYLILGYLAALFYLITVFVLLKFFSITQVVDCTAAAFAWMKKSPFFKRGGLS